MAITFTEKLRTSMGDKAYRIYNITGDGSTTDIEASSLELHYIDFAMISPATQDLSSGVYQDHAYLCVDTATTIISLGAAGTSGAKWNLEAWGW